MNNISYKEKELKRLNDLLIIYSRFGEGLTTKNLRQKIKKLKSLK